MIPRDLTQKIIETITRRNKIVLLYGPRQVGKTTLINEIIRKLPYRSLRINADQIKYRDVLSSRDLSKMKGLIGSNELLFIDEAQNIPDIGINLKILIDELPQVKIIATGSSSFDLANKVKEPLTGRTRTFFLYPISMKELAIENTPFEVQERLEEFLRFGMYPEVLEIEDEEEKVAHLRELTSAYLFKDVLKLANIKYSDKLVKLLQLLSFQIGSLVSIHELAKNLGMAQETVDAYIDLLEKGFIVFRLSGFSRNLRKEISKQNKIYFYDLGIRNALIENYKPLEWRQDKGHLWENFLIVERKKAQAYKAQYANSYFWRNYGGQELDYIEEKGGELNGFEFKFRPAKKRTPPAWRKDYSEASYELIHKENYWNFIT